MNWNDVEFFTREEFLCSHTGEERMEPEFLTLLDELRRRCGFPLHITSGYRSPVHPIEAAKSVPGTHAQGIAADIRYSNGSQLYALLSNAFDLGFKGIGVAEGFVHVDTRGTTPVSWTY